MQPKDPLDARHVNNFQVFKGFIRAQPVQLEDFAEADLKKMELDVVVPYPEKESQRQDIACAGCGKPFGKQVFRIRCGRCANGDYPRLWICTSCGECGGEELLLKRYNEHVRKEHG